MGLRELLILVLILAIIAVILRGLVAALRTRKNRIKIALEKNIPVYDLDELELRELPNGGARMVQRSFEEVMRQASELESLDAAKKRPRSKVLKTDLTREAVLARRAAALAAAEAAIARGEVVAEPDLFNASGDNRADNSETADDNQPESQGMVFRAARPGHESTDPVAAEESIAGQAAAELAGADSRTETTVEESDMTPPSWAADAIRANEYQSTLVQPADNKMDYSDDDWLDDVSPVREVAVERPAAQEVAPAFTRSSGEPERAEPTFSMMRFDDELGLVAHEESSVKAAQPDEDDPDLRELTHFDSGSADLEDDDDELEDEGTADYFLDSTVDIEDDESPLEDTVQESDPFALDSFNSADDDQHFSFELHESESEEQDPEMLATRAIHQEPEELDDVLNELLHERGVSTVVDYARMQMPEPEYQPSYEPEPVELPEEVPEEIPVEVPEELPDDAPMELPEEMPERDPVAEPEPQPEYQPPYTPEPEPEPEYQPAYEPEPEVMPEDLPADIPAESPEEMPVPAGVPEDVPDPETEPEIEPDSAPDELPAQETAVLTEPGLDESESEEPQQATSENEEPELDEPELDEPELDEEEPLPDFDSELEADPEPQPQPVDSFAAVDNKDDIDDLFKDEDQQRRLEALEQEQESTPKRFMSWAGATFGKLTSGIAESRARAAEEKAAREELAREQAAAAAQQKAEQKALQQAQQKERQKAQAEAAYQESQRADQANSDYQDPLADYSVGDIPFEPDDYPPTATDRDDYQEEFAAQIYDEHDIDERREQQSHAPVREPAPIAATPVDRNVARYGESPYKQHQFGHAPAGEAAATATSATAAASAAKSQPKPATRNPRENQLSLEMPADDDFSESGFSEVLVINVMARPNSSINGDELLPALLSAGLRFGDMSIFHRHADRRGGPVLFSVANALNPGTFDLNEISDFSTQGVTFFMTLPNVANNMLAFEQMLATARHVQSALDADLKDDNRSVMTAQTVEHYRQRIRDFELQQLKNSRQK